MVTERELIEKAFEARAFAYTPYSDFKVGAALLTRSGKVYTGCNIENAAFTPGNCAERTAFFKAVSEGEKEFVKIAIVGSLTDTPRGEGDYCAPCGVCRQVMAEFCVPELFEIILAKEEADFKSYTLKELLPLSFTGKDIQ